MASFLDLSLLFGTGVFGAILGLLAAGNRFADHLAEFAADLEKALRDPRHADLNRLVQKARKIESEAKSLLGMIRQVFKA